MPKLPRIIANHRTTCHCQRIVIIDTARPYLLPVIDTIATFFHLTIFIMVNQITKITALILLVSWSFSRAHAQSNTIDTIEITTSRVKLKAGETGRNITVLSASEISQLPFTSLDELLQYIPGIEVQSRNAFGAQGDISMRGSTFTQVLVLIDGLKLNDPLTAHFNGYMPVTPAEISRIEVLRGAAAAMFGADAVGGVVNIITKKGLSNGEEELEAQGNFSYGENALVNTQQGFNFSNEKITIGGGFSMNKSDGEHVPATAAEGATREAYDNYFDIKTVSTSAGFLLNKNWKVSARTAYDDRDFSARYFYTTSTFDKSVERTKSWWNQVQVHHFGKNSSTEFNAGYKRSTDEFVFSPDFPSTNAHLMQMLNFQVNHYRIFSDIFSVNFGGQLDQRQIESNDRGDHKDLHGGVYAVGVVKPNPNLFLTGSLRLDNDQNYGTEFTPQLNVSYLLPSITLRASAGRSIRAADYTERYVSTNLENLTPGRSLGNPGLNAEESWSEEIGFDYFFGKKIKVKATGFMRQSSNLIDYVGTNADDISDNGNLQAGENYFWASNVTDVETKGLEVEAWYSGQLKNSTSLSASIGYTYLNTNNEDEVISVYISSHAKHLVNTNLILNAEKWSLGINGLMKVRNERAATAIDAILEDQYMLWNTKIGFNPVDNFGINVQIHNVLDTEYQDILGAKMPGRWVMAGVSYNI